MLISDDLGRVSTQVARFWSKTNTNDGWRMEMESKLVTVSRIWDLEYGSVVKLHHKFMLASYMMQIAKFLALLRHNASFYNFCFIIKFSHCLIFS